MKRRFLTLAALLLRLVAPAQVFAKGETVKITIKGADLKTPIEITNPKILTEFTVWTGPGTSSSVPRFNSNAPGFIIDWSQGAIEEPPKGLQRYEVSFWAKLPKRKLIYVVLYEYDPATEQGYVYVPGRKDEWYRLNVDTIFHGVEGKWFHAWSVWNNVARPLLANPQVTTSNVGHPLPSR
jgi:hypothetical protein